MSCKVRMWHPAPSNYHPNTEESKWEGRQSINSQFPKIYSLHWHKSYPHWLSMLHSSSTHVLCAKHRICKQIWPCHSRSSLALAQGKPRRQKILDLHLSSLTLQLPTIPLCSSKIKGSQGTPHPIWTRSALSSPPWSLVFPSGRNGVAQSMDQPG